jgi:hypothetical protein
MYSTQNIYGLTCPKPTYNCYMRMQYTAYLGLVPV